MEGPTWTRKLMQFPPSLLQRRPKREMTRRSFHTYVQLPSSRGMTATPLWETRTRNTHSYPEAYGDLEQHARSSEPETTTYNIARSEKQGRRHTRRNTDPGQRAPRRPERKRRIKAIRTLSPQPSSIPPIWIALVYTTPLQPPQSYTSNHTLVSIQTKWLSNVLTRIQYVTIHRSSILGLKGLDASTWGGARRVGAISPPTTSPGVPTAVRSRRTSEHQETDGRTDGQRRAARTTTTPTGAESLGEEWEGGGQQAPSPRDLEEPCTDYNQLLASGTTSDTAEDSANAEQDLEGWR